MINARSAEKNAEPRYIQLARQLRCKIRDGEWSDIGQFPTEIELSKTYCLTRGTVREALRVLIDEGLMSRRQGSGTIVLPATARNGALHQPLSNIGEIRQYASDTSIDFRHRGMMYPPDELAINFYIKPDVKWFCVDGIRFDTHDNILAFNQAWIHPSLIDAARSLEGFGEPIFEQLENIAKFKVASITQNIQAIKPPEEVLKCLDLEPDDPVMRIVRYYFDDRDQLFEISISYHPGNRFVYSMHIEDD